MDSDFNYRQPGFFYYPSLGLINLNNFKDSLSTGSCIQPPSFAHSMPPNSAELKPTSSQLLSRSTLRPSMSCLPSEGRPKYRALSTSMAKPMSISSEILNSLYSSSPFSSLATIPEAVPFWADESNITSMDASPLISFPNTRFIKNPSLLPISESSQNTFFSDGLTTCLLCATAPVTVVTSTLPEVCPAAAIPNSLNPQLDMSLFTTSCSSVSSPSSTVGLIQAPFSRSSPYT
ncbi:unnamed protein product, partial [Protopolystoma xenopodis]